MFDRDFGEEKKLEKMTEKEKNIFKGIGLLISMLVIMGPISNSEDTSRFVITMVVCLALTILLKDFGLLKKSVYINKSILKYLIFPLLVYVIFLIPNLIFL